MAAPLIVKTHLETYNDGAELSWDIIILLADIPLPEIVTMAVLFSILGFVNIFKITVEFPDPDVLLIVIQFWLLSTNQFIFEDILNDFVLFHAGTEILLVETVSAGVAPSCVTIIVFEVIPLPEIVKIATLELPEGFAEAVKVIFLLPVPE